MRIHNNLVAFSSLNRRLAGFLISSGRSLFWLEKVEEAEPGAMAATPSSVAHRRSLSLRLQSTRASFAKLP
jgi:hypothetical protein